MIEAATFSEFYMIDVLLEKQSGLNRFTDVYWKVTFPKRRFPERDTESN